MTIASRLKRFRERKGYTQDYVGSMLGVAKQTINKYESGKITNIPLDTIEKLAVLYGVSEIDITGWKNKTETPDYIELFETLSDNDKAAVTAVMRSIATRTNSEAI